MAKHPPITLDQSTRVLATRLWTDWVYPYRGKLAVALVLMVAVAAVTGLYPLALRQAFDMFAENDVRVMWMIPPIVLALTAARAITLYLQTVLTARIAIRVIADLREGLFRHLLGADLAQIMARPTATLASRFIHDVEQIRETLIRVSTNLVRDLLTVIALFGAMIWIDWMLAALILVIYPIAIVPVVRIGKRLRRVSVNQQANVGSMTALLSESLSGARMVKTYRLEGVEAARAHTVFEGQFRLVLQAIQERARLEPVMEVLGGLAVAGVVVFAGWRMATGGSTVGDFTGFLTALLMAAQPLRAIGTLNGPLQQGLAAMQRLFEVMDEPPTIRDRPDALALTPGPGEIRLEAVAFDYAAPPPAPDENAGGTGPDGDEPGRSGDGVKTDPEEDRGPALPPTVALKDIDLIVPAGQTVALVGPSGAGKSTLLNLIPRLYDVTRGRVLIDGQDVRSVTLDSLRRSMALVSQDIVLFDDTVRANIRMGRLDADDAAVEAAARAAAAHDFIQALPDGYDTPVGDRGTRLSGGQRQRIALARAILRDAPILLLDEATSALDAESESQVQAALEALSRDRTTVVIAHRLATVRNADRIVVLDQGRVLEVGDHATLVAQGGLYARLCEMQYFAQDTGGEAPAQSTPDAADGAAGLAVATPDERTR